MSKASQGGYRGNVVLEIAESEAAVAEGGRELLVERGGVGVGTRWGWVSIGSRSQASFVSTFPHTYDRTFPVYACMTHDFLMS